jgi:hypothetical protein
MVGKDKGGSGSGPNSNSGHGGNASDRAGANSSGGSSKPVWTGSGVQKDGATSQTNRGGGTSKK